MRILVVSDVHANAAALAALPADYDVCLNLGDLVEYGPCPQPCVAWAREHCLATVRGNHDHGVAHGVDVHGVSGFRYLTMASRRATAAQLGPCDRAFLAGLPVTKMLRLGRHTFFLVHASPRDPLDEYVPPDPAAWAARVAGLDADFVLVGHTHTPLNLSVGRSTIVNPGSVGLPRDGNPRCRYALITDGKVELCEADYDVSRTVAAVHASDLDAQAKDMLADVYARGRYVHPPHLPHPHSAANGHTPGARPSGRHAPVTPPTGGPAPPPRT